MNIFPQTYISIYLASPGIQHASGRSDCILYVTGYPYLLHQRKEEEQIVMKHVLLDIQGIHRVSSLCSLYNLIFKKVLGGCQK